MLEFFGLRPDLVCDCTRCAMVFEVCLVPYNVEGSEVGSAEGGPGFGLLRVSAEEFILTFEDFRV